MPVPLQMASCSAATPTAGVRKPLPVVSLPRKLHADPVCTLVAELEAGLSPKQILPAGSEGLQSLLEATELLRDVDDEDEAARLAELARCRHIPSRFDGQTRPLTQAARSVQEALRRRLKGQDDAPRSAIRIHADLASLVDAAQLTICQPGWFLDPSLAVVVCADHAKAGEVLALMRRPAPDQASDEDPLEAAQWVAEELMPPSPGWRFSGPLPVRLASEIGPGDSFREVFLSPRSRELSAVELLPAVRAARVGLHVVHMPG